MPEGLWANGGKLQRDLATITQRIRLMGFNAVRLPFSMKDLFNLSPKYVCSARARVCLRDCEQDHTLTAQLCLYSSTTSQLCYNRQIQAHMSADPLVLYRSCTANCKAVTSAQVLQSVTRPSSSGRRLLQTGQPGG